MEYALEAALEASVEGVYPTLLQYSTRALHETIHDLYEEIKELRTRVEWKEVVPELMRPQKTLSNPSRDHDVTHQLRLERESSDPFFQHLMRDAQ